MHSHTQCRHVKCVAFWDETYELQRDAFDLKCQDFPPAKTTTWSLVLLNKNSRTWFLSAQGSKTRSALNLKGFTDSSHWASLTMEWRGCCRMIARCNTREFYGANAPNSLPCLEFLMCPVLSSVCNRWLPRRLFDPSLPTGVFVQLLQWSRLDTIFSFLQLRLLQAILAGLEFENLRCRHGGWNVLSH